MEIVAPCTHLSRAMSPKPASSHLIKYLTWLFPWDQRWVQAVGSLWMGLRLGGEKPPMPLFPSLPCSASPWHLQSPSPPSTKGWNLHPGGQGEGNEFSYARSIRTSWIPSSLGQLCQERGLPHADKTFIPVSPPLPKPHPANRAPPRATGRSLLSTAGHSKSLSSMRFPQAGEGSPPLRAVPPPPCTPGWPCPAPSPSQHLCLGHLLCSEARDCAASPRSPMAVGIHLSQQLTAIATS